MSNNDYRTARSYRAACAYVEGDLLYNEQREKQNNDGGRESDQLLGRPFIEKPSSLSSSSAVAFLQLPSLVLLAHVPLSSF
jgi:hypothetical protein